MKLWNRCYVGRILLGFVSLLVLFQGAFARISRLFPCPLLCDCDIVTQQVNCSNRGLSKLPELSASTRIILFNDNDIGDSLRVSNFNITQLIRLRQLTLVNNSLTEIQKGVLDKQGRLLKLDLSFNYLQSIPSVVREMRTLKHLYLTNNFIFNVSRVDLPKVSLLEHIHFDNNDIASVQAGAFNNQRQLRILYLGGNLISNISSGLFAQLSQLVQLDLSRNQIGVDLNMQYEYLGDIPTPKNVELKESPIASPGIPLNYSDWFYPFQASSLEFLNLRSNVIKTITQDAFKSFPVLKSLDMSENELISLPAHVFDNVTQLQRIILSKNNISEIPENLFLCNELLEYVYLNHNLLSTIPVNLFSKTNSLFVLDMSNNVIDDVRFVEHNLRKLVELNLSHNALSSMTSVGFTQLDNIEVLRLSDNELYSIPNVRNLTRLRVLDLSMNMIMSIAHDAFSDDIALEELFIQGNLISTIKLEPFVTLVNLHTLNANDNPIKCDCNVKWLADYPADVSYNSDYGGSDYGGGGGSVADGSNSAAGNALYESAMSAAQQTSAAEIGLDLLWVQSLKDDVTCTKPKWSDTLVISDVLTYYSLDLICTEFANPRSIMILILTWFLIVIVFLILFWSRTFWMARKQLGASRSHKVNLKADSKDEGDDTRYVISSVSKKTDNGQYQLLPNKNDSDPLVFLPNHDDESCKLRTYDRSTEIFIETTV